MFDRSLPLEKRYVRRDGSLVWGSLSVSVLKSHPSPLVLAMVEDITAKKTAEEARFRHAAIVQSSEDAIISKNLDAVITSWNLGAERIFGYTEAEAVGQPISILIPPELRDEEHKILERLRAGGRIEHYETIRVTKTGQKVDVSSTISPITDSSGQPVGFCEIAQAITERKRAERVLHETNQALERQTRALQAEKELLRIFVKNVPRGVAMLDREMRDLQVSDRFCGDYSVDGSQVLGRSHYEVFPDIPTAGKKFTAVLLREIHCEPTKTAGIAKAALCGRDGKCGLGGAQTDRSEAFSSLPRTLPNVSRWKRRSQT